MEELIAGLALNFDLGRKMKSAYPFSWFSSIRLKFMVLDWASTIADGGP